MNTEQQEMHVCAFAFSLRRYLSKPFIADKATNITDVISRYNIIPKPLNKSGKLSNHLSIVLFASRKTNSIVIYIIKAKILYHKVTFFALIIKNNFNHYLYYQNTNLLHPLYHGTLMAI